ncbi:helix-turn-helix transcriptional regulator [Umezawaea beigongshangensis]|uniref:helix-turn-helix transcriptional regulator n=1 Tax=Umezawaea beigongshangensis TaxID=2780383 RepID=UPI0018F25E4B|nr:helix-turn-helix transcriptional regulator [Umezawaea beigongshangensis]
MNLLELGIFLQARRARITPAEVGLPTGPRRRVPGLRRDEVSRLAGTSLEHYAELERGLGAQPSTRVLVALARVLRLDADEREHLFRLAGRAVSVTHDTAARVQPAMLALLDRLDSTPARIMTDLHETLVQNQLATALLGPPAPGESFVRRWFTDPGCRSVHPAQDHPRHSAVLVSDLRAAAARRGHDARCAEMIAHLRRASDEFARLWDAGDVAVRRGGHERVDHPELGVVDVECQNLFSEDGGQRIQFFTGPAVERLGLLAVSGARTPAGADGSVSRSAW